MVTHIDTGNIMGITRNFDDLHRVVIPMEIIKQHELKSSRVSIYPLKKGVYIEFDTEKTEE